MVASMFALFRAGVVAGAPALAVAGLATVAAAVRSEMLVSTDWPAEHLDDPRVVVLHVAAKPETYRAAHVPGARLVGWSELVATREEIPNELPSPEQLASLVARLGVDPDDRIVVYDEEAGLQAARAYVTLDTVGLGERAALLDGQLKKWKAEGRPLATGDVTAPRSTVEIVPHPRTVVGAAAARAASEARRAGRSDAPALVDARPAEQFSGAEAGEGVARPGHIPGAVSIPWTANVASADLPVLRPADELRAAYEAAGLAPGSEVIAYCRTGVQASHTYFVLKYLGYEPRLYDGSFFEWSRSPELPVESSPPTPAAP